MTTYMINGFEFDRDQLVIENVFQLVASGQMTFEDFEEWVSVQRSDAYNDGAFQQSFNECC